MTGYRFGYSEEKDRLLKKARGVGFENVIKAIKEGGLITETKHFNSKKYPNQEIMIVEMNNYVYAIPFVRDERKKVKFMKTIYPSRDLIKKYFKK